MSLMPRKLALLSLCGISSVSLAAPSWDASFCSLSPGHRNQHEASQHNEKLKALLRLSSNTPSGIPEESPDRGLLSYTIKELSEKLGGSGRSAAVWDCIRQGIDPNLYYSATHLDKALDHDILESWMDASARDIAIDGRKDTNLNPRSFDKGQGLGQKGWTKLQNVMKQHHLHVENSESKSDKTDRFDIMSIENGIASLSHMNVSSDGTTKLLLKMVKDGLEVESVIIPWMDKGFSTLCVSSQVGCRQGCSFCATGRMGKLRSLSADEILVQVYYGSKVCRVVQSCFDNSSNNSQRQSMALPPIDNIVFMGMGEPADNADAVLCAANALADRQMFSLAQSKITISTVAPDANAFATLGGAPALLAWSVHAVKDSLRLQLVPTTKESMEQLRTGLVRTLSTRSTSMRRAMLEVVLIDGVNDSNEDAELLSEFAQAIMRDAKGSKVVVNLIPFNDIGHLTHRTPSTERVLEFQRTVIKCSKENDSVGRPVLCYVRTTRGDEESSACGQLATKRKTKIG